MVFLLSDRLFVWLVDLGVLAVRWILFTSSKFPVASNIFEEMAQLPILQLSCVLANRHLGWSKCYFHLIDDPGGQRMCVIKTKQSKEIRSLSCMAAVCLLLPCFLDSGCPLCVHGSSPERWVLSSGWRSLMTSKHASRIIFHALRNQE